MAKPAKPKAAEETFTTVKVSENNREKLRSFANYGETMDEVVGRLTDKAKELEDLTLKLGALAKPGETPQQTIGRLGTQTKGLEDVVAGQSSICFIDGHDGKLLYRGYDIEELAEKSNYEETTFLLWNGHLPSSGQLKSFSTELASKRPIPREVAEIVSALPRNADAMDALRVGVAALGVFDDPMYNPQERSMSVASKVGTLVAAIHRHKHGQEIIAPREDLSFASNFLYMVTGDVPSATDAHLMDVLLILHADHELNASTFTARVIASTLSDIYSAVTGAVGALKGPLHGGANEKVVEMSNEIGSPERVDTYIESKLANKQKITGFGHRVYKTMDPRAKILKDMEEKFAKSDKERQALEILERIEVIMRDEKNLYPNVDLYSGLALNHIGIPSYLFTPVFAVGRAPGWLAHILEQYADNRIIRPRADYIGPKLTPYLPIDRRTTEQRA